MEFDIQAALIPLLIGVVITSMVIFRTNLVFQRLKFLLPDSLKPGYFRIYFLDAMNHKTIKYVRPDADHFTVGTSRYEIPKTFQYTIGNWRTPTLDYVEGKTNPVNWRVQTKEDINSSENHNRMESKVVTEGINAFKKKGFGESGVQLIMILILAGGIGFLYYNMGNKFEEMEAYLAPIVQEYAPTPIPSPLNRVP